MSRAESVTNDAAGQQATLPGIAVPVVPRLASEAEAHKRQLAAARQAAYRERKGRQIVVLIEDEEVAEAFDEYMRREAMNRAARTRSEVIEHLLRTQLLRKR